MATRTKSQAGHGVNVTVSFSDSTRFAHQHVRWTPKGVSLLTKWPFTVGAEMEFAFDHEGERHCCTGIVVGCQPLRKPPGHYETILFFVETPCHEAQKAACDCRLAHQRHYPRGEVAVGGA